MTGVRNNRDRLWDIPLTRDPYPRKTIIENNTKTTAHYAGLYATNIKSSRRPTIHAEEQQLPSVKHSYNREFEALNNFIDNIRDDQYIQQQYKLDKINQQNTINATPTNEVQIMLSYKRTRRKQI